MLMLARRTRIIVSCSGRDYIGEYGRGEGAQRRWLGVVCSRHDRGGQCKRLSRITLPRVVSSRSSAIAVPSRLSRFTGSRCDRLLNRPASSRILYDVCVCHCVCNTPRLSAQPFMRGRRALASNMLHLIQPICTLNKCTPEKRGLSSLGRLADSDAHTTQTSCLDVRAHVLEVN